MTRRIGKSERSGSASDKLSLMVDEASKVYYRAMRANSDGRPMCGTSGARLGVRARDISIGVDGKVQPGQGGLSLTPDDPARLPEEFRPESLPGGIGRLPVFEIGPRDVGSSLKISPDSRRPLWHAYLEPSRPMNLDNYQSLLCATAPAWRRYA
jgi:hypothetical protein